MIKYYCNRCGVEIKEGFNKPTKYSYLILKTPICPLIHVDFSDPEFDEFEPDDRKSTRYHLCDCCSDLMDAFLDGKPIKGIE